RLSLDDLLTGVRARKNELGIIDTPASVEAMRNKGADRTPEKRAALASAEQRARDAGRTPIPAHF
ncbi:hypothetical protein, partial [Acidisoma cellulosilyticum]|uniref:hypothetical protein n=1 Tax=Acidisoma cellulosilyticum TaxID=2802395 RepID=UPI001D0A841A